LKDDFIILLERVIDKEAVFVLSEEDFEDMLTEGSNVNLFFQVFVDLQETKKALKIHHF
jgi:hypothetical protein